LLTRGLVICYQSGFYTVQTTDGLVVCHLRGRLKQGPRVGDVVALGDWVEISLQPDGTGMIEAIQPRQRMLVRLDPTPRGVYQQIIVANPDQVVMVFACAQPKPHLGMLDRFLVIAEKQEIPAVIVANKMDLTGPEAARQTFGHYPALGYPVIYTSARASLGIEQLREQLIQKNSVLVGPSGVGKSSLLNAIQPGLGLAVREVSQTTRKGQHTTVVRQMFPLHSGGYIADTPGLKALALWDIQPEELDGYFPELRSRVAGCQFNDCTHQHERGCAVLAAVEAGQIHPDRYHSYMRMRLGQEE
jgi:ribosome biogenesis GTPase / thiamine phosphate phosphatase